MPSKPVMVRPEGGIPVFCFHDAMPVFPLSCIMDKKQSWLRPDTLPAPHDPAINCVPVHRFISVSLCCLCVFGNVFKVCLSAVLVCLMCVCCTCLQFYFLGFRHDGDVYMGDTVAVPKGSPLKPRRFYEPEKKTG